MGHLPGVSETSCQKYQTQTNNQRKYCWKLYPCKQFGVYEHVCLSINFCMIFLSDGVVCRPRRSVAVASIVSVLGGVLQRINFISKHLFVFLCQANLRLPELDGLLAESRELER